jgi:hypothetical protein
MLGKEELERLRQHKQALLLESTINRLALEADWHNLNAGIGRVTQAIRSPRWLTPVTVLLPALAGFLLVRGRPRPGSLFRQGISALKWVIPLYKLWKGYVHKPNPPSNEER